MVQHGGGTNVSARSEPEDHPSPAAPLRRVFFFFLLFLFLSYFFFFFFFSSTPCYSERASLPEARPVVQEVLVISEPVLDLGERLLQLRLAQG